MTEVGFALAAGTLAALNPCGFAMLPAYLSLFASGDGIGTSSKAPAVAVLRALAATAAMTAGFLAVFSVFGLLLTPIASTVQRSLPLVTVFVGVGVAALGLWMLSGRTLAVPLVQWSRRTSPVSGLGAMALYGVSYAVASLGCTIGPFLVVTTTTFGAGDLAAGMGAYAAYAAGMGLVVGTLAVGVALTGQAAARHARRLMPYVTRAAGALVVVAGGYVAWYGGYELRVYAGGDADDPVVDAATTVQSTLAGWADRVGAGGFGILLLALAAVAAGTAWSSARRRRRRVGSTQR